MPHPLSNITATWTEASNTYTGLSFNVSTTAYGSESRIFGFALDNSKKMELYANGDLFVYGTIHGVVSGYDANIIYAFNQANTAYSHSNLVFDIANAAYDTANTAGGVVAAAAHDQANTARDHANVGFAKANSANVLAQNIVFPQANVSSVAFLQANTARDHANVGFAQANTARTHANAAFLQANVASISFNAANAAFLKANSANVLAQNIVFPHVNAAFAYANTAFVPNANGHMEVTTSNAAVIINSTSGAFSPTFVEFNGSNLLNWRLGRSIDNGGNQASGTPGTYQEFSILRTPDAWVTHQVMLHIDGVGNIMMNSSGNTDPIFNAHASNPTATLHIMDTAASLIRHEVFGSTGTSAPQMNTRRNFFHSSNGTAGLLTGGNYLWQWQIQSPNTFTEGSLTPTYTTKVQALFIADEDHDTVNGAGTYIRFRRTLNGDFSVSEGFMIDATGYFGFNYANPLELLHAEGVDNDDALLRLKLNGAATTSTYVGSLTDESTVLENTSTTQGINFKTNSTTRLSIDVAGNVTGTANLSVSGLLKAGSFTVATLPDPGQAGAGAIVWVTDDSTGNCHAYSDGGVWRRMHNKSLVT